MASRASIRFLVGSILVVVSIVLSIYAWVKASRLSLPLSTHLTGFSTFLPIILTILKPLVDVAKNHPSTRAAAGRGQSTFSAFFNTLTFLTLCDQLLTAAPAIMAALSTTYFTPDDMMTCRLDNQWQNFWRNKDDGAIRNIESRLQCCGYRSLHDRAWPFPGGKTEGSCQSVLGYSKSCFEPWKQAEHSAAAMIFTASVLSFVLKVILSNMPMASSGTVRRGTLRRPNFTRAITSGRPDLNSAGASTSLESSRYTDNPAEEEQVQGEGQPANGQRPQSRHDHEDAETHDILHGGFRDDPERRD